MSLYEMIDEISQKQTLKSETGDSRIQGVMVGVVTQNADAQIKGRVCVCLPVRDEDGNELQWARVAMPSSGKSWGHYFLPEVGDQVLLAFEGGCIEKPYVIGCVPQDNSRLISQYGNNENSKKCIVSTSGDRMVFSDVQEQESISLFTPEDAHQLVLDNGRNEALLGDKNLDNGIKIQTSSGVITIKAKNKLVIEVGSVKATFNGSSGTIKLECAKLDVDASSAITIDSSGKLKLSGVTAQMSASSALQAESGGLLTLKGKIIKTGG